MMPAIAKLEEDIYTNTISFSISAWYPAMVDVLLEGKKELFSFVIKDLFAIAKQSFEDKIPNKISTAYDLRGSADLGSLTWQGKLSPHHYRTITQGRFGVGGKGTAKGVWAGGTKPPAILDGISGKDKKAAIAAIKSITKIAEYAIETEEEEDKKIIKIVPKGKSYEMHPDIERAEIYTVKTAPTTFHVTIFGRIIRLDKYASIPPVPEKFKSSHTGSEKEHWHWHHYRNFGFAFELRFRHNFVLKSKKEVEELKKLYAAIKIKSVEDSKVFRR